jgi:hypothetical protein
VLPNPFFSSIMIKSSEAYKGVQLNMFSYTGQLVESVYVGDFQYNYKFEGLDHLESGVYFLQMKSRDEILNATQKIVNSSSIQMKKQLQTISSVTAFIYNDQDLWT